jgi:hypothetical protein
MRRREQTIEWDGLAITWCFIDDRIAAVYSVVPVPPVEMVVELADEIEGARR